MNAFASGFFQESPLSARPRLIPAPQLTPSDFSGVSWGAGMPGGPEILVDGGAAPSQTSSQYAYVQQHAVPLHANPGRLQGFGNAHSHIFSNIPVSIGQMAPQPSTTPVSTPSQAQVRPSASSQQAPMSQDLPMPPASFSKAPASASSSKAPASASCPSTTSSTVQERNQVYRKTHQLKQDEQAMRDQATANELGIPIGPF